MARLQVEEDEAEMSSRGWNHSSDWEIASGILVVLNFYPSLKTPWAHFIIVTFIYYKYNRSSSLKLHKMIEHWYIFDFPLNDLLSRI